ARRPIGTARRFVGQPDMSCRAVGGNAVRPGQHGGGEIGYGCRVRTHIATLVVKTFVIYGEDDAFAIDRRPHPVLLLPRMIGRNEMLAAVLDPLDRPV